MADFKTHVTFSSVLGCGYAFAGMTAGMGTSTSLVAGGLCGLSGMLPDVDSDSGVPRRETMGFAAAIVPMLLVSRFREMGFDYDQMVLATAVLYFAIRFGASKLIGEFSVHRGMWHSIPAALIFAGLAFLITGSEDVKVKYFKALAVFLGTMSHLVLDEVYSVDTRGVIPKLKKSFGTAVKFWGKNPWANFSTYAKLAAVAVLVFGDLNNLSVYDSLRENYPRVAGELDGIGDRVRSLGEQVSQQVQTPPTQQQPYHQPAPYQPPPQPAPAWGPPPGWQAQPQYPAGGQSPYGQQQGGFLPNNGATPVTPWGSAPPAYANPR